MNETDGYDALHQPQVSSLVLMRVEAYRVQFTLVFLLYGRCHINRKKVGKMNAIGIRLEFLRLGKINSYIRIRAVFSLHNINALEISAA